MKTAEIKIFSKLKILIPSMKILQKFYEYSLNSIILRENEKSGCSLKSQNMFLDIFQFFLGYLKFLNKGIKTVKLKIQIIQKRT